MSTIPIVPIKASKFNNSLLFGDRLLLLDLVPKYTVVAEVGVAYGDFSKMILAKMEPAKFYAIDTFNINPDKPLWGYTFLKDSGLSHLEWYREQFAQALERDQMRLMRGLSWECLAKFEDNYFDYVYLDAAHDYDSAKKDIEMLSKKVKNGGYIQFNDYTLWSIYENKPYGIVQAVNEFLNSGDHVIRGMSIDQGGYHDILIQVIKK